MKQQVFFDASTFMTQKMGGISRYFCELIKALSELNNIDIIVFGGWSQNIYIESLRNLPNVTLIHRPRHSALKIGPIKLKSFTAKICSLLQKLSFYKAYRKNKNIVYHATYMHIDPFIKKRAKATISTFYDAIPEKFHKNNKTQSNHFFREKENCLKNSDFVIAISKSAEEDMLQLYPYLKGKTTHIHLASELPKNTSKEPLPPQPYLLWVGNRQDYKNGLNTLKAFAQIAQHHPDIHFLFCGGHDFSQEEIDVIKNNQLSQRVSLKKGVSDTALIHFYKNALALVYTSSYEGFGIPLLEAMQLGCPVITTNISSLPEVAGDAAHYTATDSTSIAKALSTIISNQELRNDLSQKGYKQIQNFSWPKTAIKTREVYNKFLVS